MKITVVRPKKPKNTVLIELTEDEAVTITNKLSDYYDDQLGETLLKLYHELEDALEEY